MRVLITGASGFIGSYLSRAVVESGHDVVILAAPQDNLWRIHDLLNRLDILRATLRDSTKINKRLHQWQPQACIHLAWYAKPGKYLASRENLKSLKWSLKLLRILSEANCQQFIGAGTCAEYKMKSEKLSETDETEPATLYAASKLSFQLIGQQLAAQSGMQFAWGRIFYLYGPKEDARRLVPSAILKLEKGELFPASPGEQVRDYLHVEDVARALLTILEKHATGIFNICSAKPVTLRQLLESIGNLTGRPELLAIGALPYREWEPMFICGNNMRLRKIGWTPQIDLRPGLKETISWWKNKKN